MARKPASLTHQEAAALATPGLTALQALDIDRVATGGSWVVSATAFLYGD